MIMILKYSLLKSFSVIKASGVAVLLAFSNNSIFQFTIHKLASLVRSYLFIDSTPSSSPFLFFVLHLFKLPLPRGLRFGSNKSWSTLLQKCEGRYKSLLSGHSKVFFKGMDRSSSLFTHRCKMSTYSNTPNTFLSDSRQVFSINSPITTELIKLFSVNDLNSDTQLKVENLLLNQESFFISNVKEGSEAGRKVIKEEINYNLPTALIREINSHIPLLEKLIQNYRKFSVNLLERNSTHIINSSSSNASQSVSDNYPEKPSISSIILSSSDDFILSILIGRLLRVISNNERINDGSYSLNVYIDLGKELIARYLYNLYRNSTNEIEPKNIQPITFKQWKQTNILLIESCQDETLYFEVGSLLIGWLKELELVDTKVIVISRTEKHNIIIVGSKLRSLLPDSSKLQSLIFVPKRIPMICPPKPYVEINSPVLLEPSASTSEAHSSENKNIQVDPCTPGGYLLNDEQYSDDLILDNWLLASKTSILPNNILYKTVNELSNTAFKINVPVLEFILGNYKKYNLLVDPDYTHPLSLKSKLTKSEKKILESFKSKRDLEANILGLASIFKLVPNFYFPIRLDYRARLYCVTEYLNYQGTELSKALLLFSKGERVLKSDTLSINYLKVYGANCFGNGLDKLSFEDRINWVNKNEELINNFTKESSKDGKSLLEKADNKLLFIAFCFEYKNYLASLKNDKEDNFITYLPIQFDASCNGFQHLTLLIKEITLYKELKLGESKWSDMPKEFYSFVALKLKYYFSKQLRILIEKEGTKSPLENSLIESYTKLMNLNIHRKLIQKPIMTIPYNASAFAIVNYFKEEFDMKQEGSNTVYYYKEDPLIKFNENDFNSLRKALGVVIFEDYPRLAELLKYLKEIAHISNKLKLQIPWKLPTGLFVQQEYYQTNTLKVKPFLYSKDLLNLRVIEKEKFNSRKQIRAFMPNLIHSLDAASLILLVNEFFKENKYKNFYSIHDCFAVTCNNVEFMMNYLKSAYCIIYSKDNYLLELNNTFLENIKDSYGPDCYDPETKRITIEKSLVSDETIKIKYPDITRVIDRK